MRSLLPLSIFLLAFSFLHAQGKMKFTKQDSLKLSYCKCDSVYKAFIGKTKPNKDDPDFDGNGWNILFNFQGKPAQCGYFNKFYFMYGLHFVYDDNGKPTKIKKFYNGKLAGLCEVKK